MPRECSVGQEAGNKTGDINGIGLDTGVNYLSALHSISILLLLYLTLCQCDIFKTTLTVVGVSV